MNFLLHYMHCLNPHTTGIDPESTLNPITIILLQDVSLETAHYNSLINPLCGILILLNVAGDYP